MSIRTTLRSSFPDNDDGEEIGRSSRHDDNDDNDFDDGGADPLAKSSPGRSPNPAISRGDDVSAFDADSNGNVSDSECGGRGFDVRRGPRCRRAVGAAMGPLPPRSFRGDDDDEDDEYENDADDVDDDGGGARNAARVDVVRVDLRA